jgi:hypothetical protein
MGQKDERNTIDRQEKESRKRIDRGERIERG